MMQSPRWIIGFALSLAVMGAEIGFPNSHNLFAFILGQISLGGLLLMLSAKPDSSNDGGTEHGE